MQRQEEHADATCATDHHTRPRPLSGLCQYLDIANGTSLHYNLITAMVLGVTTGMVHGAARALGVVTNRKHMHVGYDPLLILTAQWRWRSLDGLVLLFTAGTVAASLLSLRERIV